MDAENAQTVLHLNPHPNAQTTKGTGENRGDLMAAKRPNKRPQSIAQQRRTRTQRKSSRYSYKPLKFTENRSTSRNSIPKSSRSQRPMKKKEEYPNGQLLPKVTYKVTASGSNEITPIYEQPAKANIQLQSILAILLVSLIVPLVAGGSIALAADFAGEEIDKTTPYDTNGFSWAYGSQGDCITTTLSGTPTTASTASSTSSTINSYAGENYTSLGAMILNSTLGGTSDCYGSSASNDFRLNLPSNIFTQNDSHSRFFFEWISTGGCTASCVVESYDAGWSFDWSIYADGVKIFGDSSSQKGYMEYGSNVKPSWTLNYSLNVVDYNKLSSQISECESSCSYVLHFDNVQRNSYSGVDYSSTPWAYQGNYKVQTSSLDDLSASFVMAVTPWALTIFFSLVTLASTPFWDPVFKKSKDIMRNGVIQ